MPYVVERASPCKIADTSAKLNPLILQQVRSAGYAGVARYVPLPNNNPKSDIDAQELGAIMEVGLGLLLVQHVRAPTWDPDQHSGETDARTAVQFARAAGYLDGAHLFVDLEGIHGSGAATKAFAEAWARVVVGEGFLAGAYVGYGVPLNPQELYDLHAITSYWSDLGPRVVAQRSFAIKQQAEIVIAGTRFDPDTIQADDLGETPAWMTMAQATPDVA
jgi:hypothetical protein